MTLFIAVILLYQFDFGFLWYVAAVAIWGLRLYVLHFIDELITRRFQFVAEALDEVARLIKEQRR